jgi:hypothetical protein
MHDVDGEGAPPPGEAPEKVERARAFCTELFSRLRAAVDVTVRETPEAIGVSLAPREGNGVELSGALVEAVQYLVNRVVNPRAEGRKWVNLEVEASPTEPTRPPARWRCAWPRRRVAPARRSPSRP